MTLVTFKIVCSSFLYAIQNLIVLLSRKLATTKYKVSVTNFSIISIKTADSYGVKINFVS